MYNSISQRELVEKYLMCGNMTVEGMLSKMREMVDNKWVVVNGCRYRLNSATVTILQSVLQEVDGKKFEI